MMLFGGIECDPDIVPVDGAIRGLSEFFKWNLELFVHEVGYVYVIGSLRADFP